MKKAHQLAGYMTTGIAGPGLLRNAAAVANLLGDRVSGLGAPGVTAKPDSYVDMVDQLISLYALDVQPKDVTDSLSALIKSEPGAMKQLLGVMREQRSKDMARQTGNAKFNAVKGYIPSDGTAGASLVVRDVRDEANLRVALLAGAGLPGVELPVTENVFTKAMEGTLGYSMGPGMLFSAPELNPWVAAMQ